MYSSYEVMRFTFCSIPVPGADMSVVDHKELGYRVYYKYEREEDKDVAIHTMAAHYSYRELTEDNYESVLEEFFKDEGHWDEQHKKKWENIVLACWCFLPAFFSFRLHG